MSRLTQLPTELRQQILLLALPDTNRIGSSTQVLRLFHMDELLREDMATVVALWSPLYYISHPKRAVGHAAYPRLEIRSHLLGPLLHL